MLLPILDALWSISPRRGGVMDLSEAWNFDLRIRHQWAMWKQTLIETGSMSDDTRRWRNGEIWKVWAARKLISAKDGKRSWDKWLSSWAMSLAGPAWCARLYLIDGTTVQIGNWVLGRWPSWYSSHHHQHTAVHRGQNFIHASQWLYHYCNLSKLGFMVTTRKILLSTRLISAQLEQSVYHSRRGSYTLTDCGGTLICVPILS